MSPPPPCAERITLTLAFVLLGRVGLPSPNHYALIIRLSSWFTGQQKILRAVLKRGNKRLLFYNIADCFLSLLVFHPCLFLFFSRILSACRYIHDSVLSRCSFHCTSFILYRKNDAKRKYFVCSTERTV